MNRIGVGIIGLSADAGWAARSHLPALRALGGQFEITAVAGSSPERSRAAATQYGIACAADSAAALAAHPDVDLVVVAVKVPHHRVLVEAALAARKAVLCEWPLAIDAAEADLLAAHAAGAGVRNFVGLQARASAAMQQLRTLIRDGAIGDILASNIVAAVGVPWNGMTDRSRTYLNRNASGATMLSIPFGHCLDAMNWVLGDFATFSAELMTRRTATLVQDEGILIPTDVADQVMVSGRLESGAAAVLHYRGGLSSAGNFRWEINGTDGDILVQGGDGHLQYGRVDILLAKTGAPLAPVVLPPDPLPPHGRAIAAQYRAIHAAMIGAPSDGPDFAHAAALHHKLGAIADKAAAAH